MQTPITCLTASALLLLTACGGGSSSTPAGNNTNDPANPDGGGGNIPSGSISFYGTIEISDEESGDRVDLSGGFLQLSNSVTSAAFQQAIGLLNDAPDTCEFTVTQIAIPDIDSGDFDINLPNVVPSSVSAGEIIPFTSTSGTFANLEKMVTVDPSFTGYTLEGDPSNGIAGPVPSSLSFDIPGDVFPAFPNVAVQDVDTLVVTSPAQNAQVTGDTIFTWEAAPGSEAVISIDATGTQFDPENPTNFGFTNLNCEVIDDGNFTIPAATQAELAAAGNLILTAMTRTLSRLEQSSNASLIITRSSEF